MNLYTQIVRTNVTFGLNQSGIATAVVCKGNVRLVERIRAIYAPAISTLESRITSVGKRGTKAKVVGLWYLPVLRQLAALLQCLCSLRNSIFGMRSKQQSLLTDGRPNCGHDSHIGSPSPADHQGTLAHHG